MFNKLDWKFILRLVISLALFGWLIFSVKWQEIISSLIGMSHLWLGGAFLCIILAVAVSVIKWRIILKAQGLELSWATLWKTYWAGLFFNNFLPSSIGGDALRIMWVGKYSGDKAGAATSVIVERILATSGLAIVGVLAGLYIPSSMPQVVMVFIILAVVSFILLAVLMWGLPTSLEGKNSRIARFLSGIKHHGELIRKKPADIVAALIWSIVFQICVIAVNYCIFIGLNLTQLSWIDYMYVIPAVSVAAMLPLGINGYGIREGAYIALLAPYGVSAAVAFSASVLFAFLVSLCSLWGGLIWMRHREKGEKRYVSVESV